MHEEEAEAALQLFQNGRMFDILRTSCWLRPVKENKGKQRGRAPEGSGERMGRGGDRGEGGASGCRDVFGLRRPVAPPHGDDHLSMENNGEPSGWPPQVEGEASKAEVDALIKGVHRTTNYHCGALVLAFKGILNSRLAIVVAKKA